MRRIDRGLARPSALRYAATLAVLAALYFFSSKFGLSLAYVHSSASAVWPPTGIALAASLLFGTRVWPAIFAGAFLVNLTTTGVWWASLGIAAGNTLEALVGALCVKRFARGHLAFVSSKGFFRFLLFAAVLSTAISATAGVTTLCAGGLAGWNEYGPIWLTWWLGDMVSDILIAPLILIWSSRHFPRFGYRETAEFALLLGACFLVSQIIFQEWFFHIGSYPLEFLCIPLLLAAAFRFGPRGASASSFLMSAVAVWGTVNGNGPFALDPNESFRLLQAFMGTVATTVLALGVVREQNRRVEKGLQEQTLRKSAILNTSLDCIISMDAEGRIIDFNPAAEKTFGYSSREVLGQKLAEKIIPPSFREVHRVGLKRYLETGEGPVIGRRLELTGMRSDSSEFPVELAIQALVINRRPIFTAYLRDITERKRAEERFRLVVEAAPTGMVMVNREGGILLVNSQIEKQFGYRREELLGQPVEVLVPERFRGKHADHRTGFFAAPRLRAMGAGRDLYGLRKDGSEFPVEIGLNPIQTVEGLAVMASVIDITERKRAEEDRLRLAAIVESSEDAIVGETLGGIITSWNKGAERLYGYAAAEILGRPISVLDLPERRGEKAALLLGHLKQGQSVEHYETVRIRKDQKKIHVSVTLSPIRDASGQIIGASAIARNVTELKLAEEALRAANKRLAELVSLKDEFVASVSHELRTPLSAIKEGVSLLVDRVVGPLNEEQEDFLKTIDESVSRLAELINNLLDLSKIAAGKFRLSPQRVRLQEIVDTLLANYKTIAGRRNIRTNIDAVSDVFADPDRLLQILGNLFSNAVKYTSAEGTITLSAQQQGGFVAVSVEDDGAGIANEDLSKLFKKFSQVGKNQAKGTGLGLALVKQLVEMHQGSIFVTSKVGSGSRFTFTMPVYVPHIAKEESLSSG